MIKRFLPIVTVLILMLFLTTTALAAPSDVTVFNEAITIHNVIRAGDINAEANFDQAQVDKALDMHDEHRPDSGSILLYYCSDAPVTVTLNKVEEGNKAISWYVCYYLYLSSEPTFDLTEYDVEVVDPATGSSHTARASSGTITFTKPGTYYINAINYNNAPEERDIGIYIVVGDTPIPTPTPISTPTQGTPSTMTGIAPVKAENGRNLAWLVIPGAIVAIVLVALVAIKRR